MANTLKDKVKTKIQETFNTTPPVVRWLLLVAAFVVVLILLFLLIGQPKKKAAPVVGTDYDIDLVISPENVDFSNTKIGQKQTQKFKINATHDAIVDSVSVQDSVSGFSANTFGCANKPVNKDIPCSVDVTFIPGDSNVSGKVTLLVEWHDKNDTENTNLKTSKIVIPVSATGGVAEPEQKPVVKPEPVSAPISEPDPIVPEDDFLIDEEDDFEEPEPIVGGNRNIFGATEEITPRRKAPEKCSDFAMPGYDMSGEQIGWIKPKAGRYEFHPFSDVECNSPTGIYNPDTGIITSIEGRKKIGTDADHRGGTVNTNTVPQLRSKSTRVAAPATSGSYVPKGMGNLRKTMKPQEGSGVLNFAKNELKKEALMGSSNESESVYSSMPYDRTFILRQFKPIPATIVSDVRADPSVYGCDLGSKTCEGGSGIPVRATVDRNVYSDNGRTIIIPTGTLLMGYLKGELPGPYKSIGRMEIKWYQFIRPDGVEFNFENKDQDPYSADSQGRVGVPGYGSTDYIEQMVMPLLTAVIPAAVNMIAPIADTFVNQIDLDNNTVVQSGKVRSSELAKNEVITAWNQVAQKLIVDALDNTVPPFSIAAGTRITVYSPVDLVATCGEGDEAGANAGKKCAFHEFNKKNRRKWSDVQGGITVNPDDSSWTGQSRGFNLSKFCTRKDNDVWTVDDGKLEEIRKSGYDYKTVLAYCQAQNYQAVNQAKYDAYYQNKMKNSTMTNTIAQNDDTGIITTTYSDEFNKDVLGLQYDGDNIINPFEKPAAPAADTVGTLLCEDGTSPDANGCCTGEIYTEMGPDSDLPYACCPAGSGDCFPPLEVY